MTRHRVFKRGYEVKSGPWPFYRIFMAMVFVGCVVQLIKSGVPASVRNGLPTWHGWALSAMLIAGSFLILLAVVFMRQNLLALTLEQSGSWFVFGAAGLYFVNFFLTSGVPETVQTWAFMSVLLYCPIRIAQLNKEIKKTRSILKNTPRAEE